MKLNSDDVARITGGTWFHAGGEVIQFHSVRTNTEFLNEGDLWFATNLEHWGKNIPNNEMMFEEAIQAGAIAIVTSNKELVHKVEKPVLVVANSKHALRDIAFYARDNIDIQRVVVTGAVGKTGFKNQLYKLLSHQTSAHARLDSANMTVAIMCSLASVGENDAVEIVEVASATSGVGELRSNLVRPDICVITEIGFEHIETGGTFENIVENKAAIVDGLKEGGICILNANSKNYDLIREAVYQRKFVNIKTFGKRPKDNARLLSAAFDNKKLLWNVKAVIEGESLEYIVPLLGEHVPVSSLAPLLVIHHLGYDMQEAAADFKNIDSYETMGTYSEVECEEKKFIVYDHSHRGSVLSYSSAMQDLNRISPCGKGRKIAILGNMLFIGKESKAAHAGLVQMINQSDIDKLYIVGEDAKCMIPDLKDESILVQYADEYEGIQDSVLGDIRDGDLIFIKGPVKAYLNKLAKQIYALGNRNEIR